MARAEIRDPEVLLAVRKELIDFDAECKRALADVDNSVHRVREWLGRDQLAYWKAERRKREEAVRRAKYELSRATRGPDTLMKKSGFDERKALHRATLALEEAERKIETVKRWTRLLDEQVRPLMVGCTQLRNWLLRDTPRALARLDRMVEALQDYHGPEGS